MNFNIFTFILAYTLLPNLYYRFFSGRVLKKIRTKEKNIMLTFDDGPDPRYTPHLLDLLKKHNVKATFFVLAEKARKYPEIISRITEEGHEIGLHYLSHSNALFRSPIQTRNDFIKALNILNDMGLKIRVFRPPWGLFNPFTYHYAKANNFKVILWSQHAFDWTWWNKAEKIKKSLIKKTKKGSIILLHDGRGAKGAPAKTIQALHEALPLLKKKLFRFITVDDLPGGVTVENSVEMLYQNSRHFSG